MTDHVAFKAIADPAKATMEITMVRNGTPVASVEIDTKDASAIAGVVLSAAKSAYDEGNGRPRPYLGRKEVSLTAITPSGMNVSPGHTPQSVMMIFHFGDTSLGIAIPQSELLTFGQHLMTLGAAGPAH
jgi:hypothetical protein